MASRQIRIDSLPEESGVPQRSKRPASPILSRPSFLQKILGPRPLSFKVAIFSDFDGTISQTDSLKHVLNVGADPRWHEIENAMAEGTMAEREGLRRCFEFYPHSFDRMLKDVMEGVRIDPAFGRFKTWCDRRGHSLNILSGGFQSLIRPLFAREGLTDLRILANDVTVVGTGSEIQACSVSPLCDLCNHCKSASLLDTIKRDPRTCVVYIGDGHTDSCPVQLADIVFAKGHLADHCRSTGIHYFEFENFQDVLRRLRWKLRVIERHLLAQSGLPEEPSLLKQTLFRPRTALSWPALRFVERAKNAA